MMRILLLFLALVSFACQSFGETIPATLSSNGPAVPYFSVPGYGGLDANAACQSASTGTYGTRYYGVTSGGIVAPRTLTCNGTDGWGPTYRANFISYTHLWKCPTGQTPTSLVDQDANPNNCSGGYSCPAGQGWTLSGSSCSRPDCQAGYDRNAQGQCVKDCTGKTGQTPPSPSYEFTNDGGTPSVGGCNVNCATWRRSGGGTSLIPFLMVGENCKYTGTSTADNDTEGTGFTPKPAEPKKAGDCIGSGQGYITSSSGSVTCVPSVQAPPGQQPSSSHKGGSESGTPDASGKPDPNASDYKKIEEDTQAENGKVKQTEKETIKGTPNGSGGVDCPAGYTLESGTSNCAKLKTTVSDQGDFCAKNPQAAVCKGTEEADECLKNPDRVSCMNAGTVDEGADTMGTKEVGSSSLTPVSLAGSASCPSDISLPKGMSFSWTSVCDGASAIRPFFLICAWLAASLIVMGLGARGSS